MSADEKDYAEHRREVDRRWREANAEHLRDYRRRYREKNSEYLAERARAWREANLERARQHNRDSERRRSARLRQQQARNARARERYPEIRDQQIERGRRFRREHPDKVCEYQRRYKERHPERHRANAAATAQRYRDAHADEIRERQRLAAAERRRANPDAYKEQYARNIEKQRERGRNASRRRARLKALGLPPRHVHRTYAADKRAHTADADEFFRRQRSLDIRSAITLEASHPDALAVPDRVDTRRRQLLRGSPSIPAIERVRRTVREPEYRQRLQDWQDVRRAETLRARRARDLQRVRESHEAARQKILDSRPAIYEGHRRRRQAKVREEVRMDSIARAQRGLPPYDLDRETQERLDAEVAETLRTRLGEVRDRTLRRVDGVLDKYDRAAPHGTSPGVRGSGSGPSIAR
ncbi:hypothetical protein [Microbacterium sp. LWH11-1.2]|uniref:hypothetical protein n=1 Tax=Microbacterium sp. LWH11-1.2 TaxID=3135258 RepID=UPI00313966C4